MRYLFPLSADPIHFGHVEVIRQILLRMQEGDHLTVVILPNGAKDPLLLPHIRLRLVRETLDHFLNVNSAKVSVVASSAPLVDFWLSDDRPIIFRGIRSSADLEYEQAQFRLHRLIQPTMDFRTIELYSHQHVSSSVVKGMVSQGFWVPSMVPSIVERVLFDEILGVSIVSVTGNMGSGKSLLTQLRGGKDIDLSDPFGFPASRHRHFIDVDALAREVWTDSTEASAHLRRRLLALDSAAIHESTDSSGRVQRSLDRVRMRTLMAQGKLVEFDLLPHVEAKIRRVISSALGPTTFLLEWAAIAEMGLGHWSHHQHILVVPENEETHRYFLAKRGVDPTFHQAVMERQWPADKIEGTLLAADSWARVKRFVTTKEMSPV